MTHEIKIKRFPPSSDKSLKAFSAADELMLKLAAPHISTTSNITIINDRFGYLSLRLKSNQLDIITHFKSQEDAICRNYELNGFHLDPDDFSKPINGNENKCYIIILKVPKSMELFNLFLIRAHQLSHSGTKVFCGFMTRHFTARILELASKYFEDLEQSKAWKKSRVLQLTKPKSDVIDVTPINTITFENHRGTHLTFQQYFGVFSAHHIDYATQFLLQHLEIDSSVERVLDLACGNGVLAQETRSQSDAAEIHLLDDSFLAIESAKLNITNGKNHFHYAYNLDHFDDQYFDIVVCNPPFHFEHENTIDIALQLFEGVSRTLKPQGSFILVANQHLNYKTHLNQIFNQVEVVNKNSKFEIIRCTN